MQAPVILGLFGGGEMWIILVIALLLFGASKLPKLARAAGASVNEFKKGMKDGVAEEQNPDAPKK